MRIVIAEDSLLLREGIARVLEAEGFEVAGQAGDGEELMRLVREQRPDVAVIDIRMPPDHLDEGLRAAHAIRAELPEVAVLVLSQYVDERYAVQLLERGAESVGYLLKDRVADGAAFADAIRRVADGGSALDPEVVTHLLAGRTGDDPLATLTPRETEVLGLMAEGLSNGAIALRLDVTERGVERHVTSIFEKLGLPADGARHRRVLAVLRYVQGSG
jgi:DNA-binding NarL/FixJ family response regulator